MAGGVDVSISSLEALRDLLTQTLPMLDRLQTENLNNIKQTQAKIDLILDDYASRARIACVNYQTAWSDLKDAERSCEDVSDNNYRAVEETRDEYHRLQQCCSELKAIKSEYDTRVNLYEKSIVDTVGSYSDLIKKSDSFLVTFIEFLQQSQSALGSGSVGGPAAMASVSGITANGSGRQLTSTEQSWVTNGDGTMTFNSPVETGATLDSKQGKVEGFGGTCGLVSCVNVLKMTGINVTEHEIVDYALSKGLCRSNSNREVNGGTAMTDRQAILSGFGVNSELRTASVDNIASAVSEGRGVIASLDAGKLWDNPDYYGGFHAVTITSVTKDSNGKVLGFHVCDSGTGGKDSAAYYSADRISNALSGRPLNVTSVIR